MNSYRGAAAAAVRGGARRPRRGTTSVWGAGAHGAPGAARAVYITFKARKRKPRYEGYMKARDKAGRRRWTPVGRRVQPTTHSAAALLALNDQPAAGPADLTRPCARHRQRHATTAARSHAPYGVYADRHRAWFRLSPAHHVHHAPFSSSILDHPPQSHSRISQPHPISHDDVRRSGGYVWVCTFARSR